MFSKFLVLAAVLATATAETPVTMEGCTIKVNPCKIDNGGCAGDMPTCDPNAPEATRCKHPCDVNNGGCDAVLQDCERDGGTATCIAKRPLGQGWTPPMYRTSMNNFDGDSSYIAFTGIYTMATCLTKCEDHLRTQTPDDLDGVCMYLTKVADTGACTTDQCNQLGGNCRMRWFSPTQGIGGTAPQFHDPSYTYNAPAYIMTLYENHGYRVAWNRISKTPNTDSNGATITGQLTCEKMFPQKPDGSPFLIPHHCPESWMGAPWLDHTLTQGNPSETILFGEHVANNNGAKACMADMQGGCLYQVGKRVGTATRPDGSPEDTGFTAAQIEAASDAYDAYTYPWTV